jgi:hypothetical protein
LTKAGCEGEAPRNGTVIPAKAGIHLLLLKASKRQVDPGFRRDDEGG